MIPLQLEVKNFLPYRDPAPLDFSGLHVACLAGDNGAGKSALLDAMTWSLWGKARVNAADALIHQNHVEMWVVFTFALGRETYRVLRQRKAGKPGQTLLDLQLLEEGGWRSLAEDNLTKTQRKITRLLRLDYETFVNSAFLMQGRADAFTVKTPAERKQVLADILGLEQWEQYEDRAKNRIAQAEQAIAILDRQIADLETELSRRDTYEAELAQAQAQATTLAEQVLAAEREWHDLEQARQLLVNLQRQIDDLARRQTRTERELRETESELAAAQTKADASALNGTLDAAVAALAALDARDAERERTTAARQEVAAAAG
jgi:exonuclease SbcC